MDLSRPEFPPEAALPPEPGVLRVFVPGVLKNVDNGSHGRMWRVGQQYRKTWRQRVANEVRAAMLRQRWTSAPSEPKVIRLVGYVDRLLDRAGLAAALKGVEDGLQVPKPYRQRVGATHCSRCEKLLVGRDRCACGKRRRPAGGQLIEKLAPGAGVIDDDGPNTPHVWEPHSQVLAKPYKRDRAQRFSPTIDPRGVLIVVRLKRDVSGMRGDDDR